MIDLTIKTLDSQNHKFKVPDTFTILELKEHIVEKVNVPVVQQRLIFCGRVLSNETKLADIGIDGKVMHLVQKVPRLATTTSGSSSSTTTNTNSRSGQNGGPGFRGWHTHDPTVLFGAIGIPSEVVHAGELPRLLGARTQGTTNRISLALYMIRRSNDILNRLENPRATGQSSATDIEQLSEGSQSVEDMLLTGIIPLQSSVPESSVLESSVPESSVPESSVPESSVSESSVPQTQTDSSDSVNVSYEVDETFPNTVVVTIDATHHMRMPPDLMRQMHDHMQSSYSHQISPEQTVESEATTVVSETPPVISTNQSSVEQAARTLPSSATSGQNSRNDRHTSENRPAALNDRRRLKELVEQLHKLNTRLQPFYTLYCQYLNDDPQFESTEGENVQRAQAVFNGVSEVMHYISHVYHAISDLRVSFNRPPPRSVQSGPCLLQGTILHAAHTVTTAPPSSNQQPTSTQTTTTSQSIPSVRAFRLDFMSPEGVGSESPNVSTSATSTETNTNMTADPTIENNRSLDFSTDSSPAVEVMFDLSPETIHIDSVEAEFVSPNTSGSTQPTTVSQSSSSSESSTISMPIDWMDQMIDVISSGVRRPFVSDQSFDWGSIPTTSTRTPRVTPRSTDSSSITNPPSQGLSRGRWENSPRMDPFLACSSHHFESTFRPLMLGRRPTQGTERSTSSANNGGGSTAVDNPTPTSNEIRSLPVRRSGRPRARYLPDSEPFLSGVHPILTWGRNHRNNIAMTSASNNVQATGQGNGVSDVLAGQIRVGIDGIFDSLERRDVNFDRARESIIQPPSSSAPDSGTTLSTAPRSAIRQPNELLLTPIGNIPFFRNLEGQSILVDLFMLLARNWTLHDLLNLNTVDLESSIVQNPVSRNTVTLVNFVLNRIMCNQPINAQTVDQAAHRIYLEMMSYINIFQCSVTTRTNINVSASFLRCISYNLRLIAIRCEQHRGGITSDILTPLAMLAERLLSLIVYCCDNRAVFRLSVIALMQMLPLPTSLHRLVFNEVRMNVDLYWDSMMMNGSIVDYIVPSNDLEVGQTSRVENEEPSSIPTLPSSDIVNEPLPEVVIGSQEWHNSVPSEWVPVISRDSQRQRRQGTQPPYSDAYLSGMPNKRRKIVTSSKPQGPLSQIIAKNLEVAMGAAGVAINKEVTASVGADSEVQNAYTERIRMFGRSGLDTHPDFCPDRYPNASKFFYDHNHPN